MKNKNNFWRDIEKESKAIAKAEKMIEKKQGKMFDRWAKKQEREWRLKERKINKDWL